MNWGICGKGEDSEWWNEEIKEIIFASQDEIPLGSEGREDVKKPCYRFIPFRVTISSVDSVRILER